MQFQFIFQLSLCLLSISPSTQWYLFPQHFCAPLGEGETTWKSLLITLPALPTLLPAYCSVETPAPPFADPADVPGRWQGDFQSQGSMAMLPWLGGKALTVLPFPLHCLTWIKAFPRKEINYLWFISLSWGWLGCSECPPGWAIAAPISLL